MSQEIKELKEFLAKCGEIDLLHTVTRMDEEGTHLRMRLAKSRQEPCHGQCWFDGRCPNDPVCNN